MSVVLCRFLRQDCLLNNCVIAQGKSTGELKFLIHGGGYQGAGSSSTGYGTTAGGATAGGATHGSGTHGSGIRGSEHESGRPIT